MRKMLMTAILAGATMFAPGLTAPAHAYGWFSIGTGFRVGGLSLSFVLGQPFAAYAPAYYYRAYQPIAYGGYHCTSRCFVDRGVYYHDRACPVVHAYFRSYGYDPGAIFVRYAPRYDGYYNGSYNNGYYNGYNSYNSYNSYYNGGGYSYDRRYDGRYYGGGYGSYGGRRSFDGGRSFDGRRGFDRRDDHGRHDEHGRRDDHGRRGDHGRRDDHGRHDDHGHHGDHQHH